MSDTSLYRIVFAAPAELTDERDEILTLVAELNQLPEPRAFRLQVGILPLPPTSPEQLEDAVKACDFFVMALPDTWEVSPADPTFDPQEWAVTALAGELGGTVQQVLFLFRRDESLPEPAPDTAAHQVAALRDLLFKQYRRVSRDYHTPAGLGDILYAQLLRWPTAERPIIPAEIVQQAWELAENDHLPEAKTGFQWAAELDDTAESLLAYADFWLTQPGPGPTTAAMLYDAASRKAENQHDAPRLARASLGRGEIQYRLDQLDDAADTLLRAHDLYEQLGDYAARARCCILLSHTFYENNAPAGAQHYTLQALDLYTTHPELSNRKKYLGICYDRMYRLLKARHHLEGAEIMLHHCLALDEADGETPALASTCHNLATLCKRRGNLAEAEELQRRAIAIFEAHDNKQELASAYLNLSITLGQLGRPDEKEAKLRQALALFEELQDASGMSVCYGNLGIHLQHHGDLDEAEVLLRRSLALEQKAGNIARVANACIDLGDVARLRGDLAAAEAQLRQALALYTELAKPTGQADAYFALGNVLLAQANLPAAEAAQQQALALNEQTNRAAEHAECQAALGQIRQAQGRPAEAQVLYQIALAAARQMGSLPLIARFEAWLQTVAQ